MPLQDVASGCSEHAGAVLVSETRTIVFTNPEVARAIAAFRRARNAPLPGGEIVDIAFGASPEIYARGKDVDSLSGHAHDFRIQGAELGAAIIMFCLNEHIPLPASNNSKRLQLFGESLGLVIHVNMPAGTATPYI